MDSVLRFCFARHEGCELVDIVSGAGMSRCAWAGFQREGWEEVRGRSELGFSIGVYVR